MEIEYSTFPIELKTSLNSRYQSICFENISSVASTYNMETRPIQVPSNIHERISRVMPSPILLDRETSDESLSRNGYNNFSSTSKVYSVMVPKGITNDYLRPNLSPKNRKLIAESKLSKSCYHGKQNLAVHGFSKKLFAQGLSEKFVTLILDSRKKDAISHYESIVILFLQSE